MNTSFTQKLINLSDQNTIINVLYSSLMICVFAQKQPDIFKKMLENTQQDIIEELNHHLFQISKEEVLHKEKYFDPLPEKVIIDLTNLAFKTITHHDYIALEIREFIEQNPKRLGFSTTPKVLKDIFCVILEHYQNEHNFQSFYDFNGGIGNLFECIVSQKESFNPSDIYIEERNPLFQQIGKMLMILAQPTANIHYLLRNSLRSAYITEKDIKVDCVLSVPRMGRLFKYELDEINENLFINHDVPKTQNAETLSIQLALHSLKHNGKAIILVPDGFLHKQGYEAYIRRNLLNYSGYDYRYAGQILETVIALPNNLFPGMTLSTSLLILSTERKKQPSLVNMVDLSQDDINLNNLKEILNLIDYSDHTIEHDSLVKVHFDEIRHYDFSLRPIEYLGSKTEPQLPNLSDDIKVLDSLKLEFDQAYHDWNKLISTK